MKTKVNVMKKVLGFVLTLVIMCSMLPMTSNATGSTTTVYLDASLWDPASARFEVYCFKTGEPEVWAVMSRIDNTNYFKADVPSDYTIIFARMNPNGAQNTFDSRWNQTANLPLTEKTEGCLYTVADWDGSDNTRWSHPDSTGDGVCDLCGHFTDGTIAKEGGHSLSVTGNIGVNFYMELADIVTKDDTAKMQFTLPNGSTSEVLVNEADTKKIDEITYYIFTCEVAAKEMASDIKAKIVTSNDESAEYTYSVKDYANALITKNSSATEVAFAKAMLNYGAASQTYFGYNASNLANEGLDTAVGSYAANELVAYEATVTDTNGILTDEKANLVLESETTLNIKFTTASEASSIVLNEDATSASGLNYVIPVSNLNASQLDNTQTVVVTVNGQEATITCSALSYCYSVLKNNSTDTNLVNVVCALYDYNKAAIDYLGNK